MCTGGWTHTPGGDPLLSFFDLPILLGTRPIRRPAPARVYPSGGGTDKKARPIGALPLFHPGGAPDGRDGVADQPLTI